MNQSDIEKIGMIADLHGTSPSDIRVLWRYKDRSWLVSFGPISESNTDLSVCINDALGSTLAHFANRPGEFKLYIDLYKRASESFTKDAIK